MVCTLLAGVNVVAFAAEADDELTDSTPVFCAYNKNNGEHFFTTDEAEYNHLVELTWGDEGEKWQAPVKSSSPIFRLYNQNSGEHYFTLDANEARSLASIGWNDEGIGLYSDDEEATPVYCMYNPNATGQFEAGAHHYTKDAAEAAYLESIGWVWTNDGQAAFYGVKEEEPQVIVNIKEVDQLTASSIKVEFDQDASLLVDKDDITVAKADGTLVLPANSMEFGLDGTTAELKLSIPLEDGVDYVVSLDESMSQFTASVGDPAYVTVPTASAQKGVSTPIEFFIYDESGVDITDTIDLSNEVEIDAVYDDAQVDISDPANPSITMNTVGEEATIIVTWSDPEDDDNVIVGKGTITCVPAEAVMGYPIYAEYDPADPTFISKNNNMAKFYLSEQTMSSDPVSVEEGGQSDVVYFSAVNLADSSVYSYDEYEVSSSDDDIMSVDLYEDANAPANTGKQLAVRVTGNQVGTANIVVKATVNDTESYYTIPVKVTPEGYVKSLTVTTTKTTMTNAIDEDYYSTTTVKAYDNNGEEITGNAGVNYSYEVTSGTHDGTPEGSKKDIDDTAKDIPTALTASYGFFVSDSNALPALDDNQFVATSWAASSGKRTVQCTVNDGLAEKTKSVTFNVQAISSSVWKNHRTGATGGNETKYAVELSESSVFSNPDDLAKDAFYGVTARLAATVGGKFVGYVRTGNDYQGQDSVYIGQKTTGAGLSGTTGSMIVVSKKTAIEPGTLSIAAKNNGKYTTGMTQVAYGQGNFENGVLLAGATSDTYKLTQKETLDAVNTKVADDLSGTVVQAFDAMTAVMGGRDYAYYLEKQNKMTDFAAPEKYEIHYLWYTEDQYDDTGALKGNATISDQKAILTVGNVIQDVAKAEIVTVTTRNVESLDAEGVKEVVVARADMNNNDGDTSVLDGIGFADEDFAAINDWGSDNQFVKYAVVHEAVYGNMYVDFYVPISTNFRLK